MDLSRRIAGLLAALVITASSVAHSVLGWPVMRGRLAATNTPDDLARGLGVGWVWGGVCMATFGVMLLWYIARDWRGVRAPVAPFRLIGVTYVLFGLAALRVSDGDPFYAVFVVPGLLLLYAGAGRQARGV